MNVNRPLDLNILEVLSPKAADDRLPLWTDQPVDGDFAQLLEDELTDTALQAEEALEEATSSQLTQGLPLELDGQEVAVSSAEKPTLEATDEQTPLLQLISNARNYDVTVDNPRALVNRSEPTSSLPTSSQPSESASSVAGALATSTPLETSEQQDALGVTQPPSAPVVSRSASRGDVATMSSERLLSAEVTPSDEMIIDIPPIAALKHADLLTNTTAEKLTPTKAQADAENTTIANTRGQDAIAAGGIAEKGMATQADAMATLAETANDAETALRADAQSLPIGQKAERSSQLRSKSSSDFAITEQAATDKSLLDKTLTATPTADTEAYQALTTQISAKPESATKVSTDKPLIDKLSIDKSLTDKLPTDKPLIDKLGIDKAPLPASAVAGQDVAQANGSLSTAESTMTDAKSAKISTPASSMVDKNQHADKLSNSSVATPLATPVTTESQAQQSAAQLGAQSLAIEPGTQTPSQQQPTLLASPLINGKQDEATPSFAEHQKQKNQQQSQQQSSAQQGETLQQTSEQKAAAGNVVEPAFALPSSPATFKADAVMHSSAPAPTSAIAHHSQASTPVSATPSPLFVNDKPELVASSLSLLAPDAAVQMKDRLVYQINQKIQSAEVKITPEDLGTVQIKLNLQQDQLSVQFVVQQQNAKELLEQQLPKLKELLQQQGLQLADSHVEQRQAGEGRQQGSEQSNPRGYAGRRDLEAELPQAAKLKPKSDRMVDYYA